MTITVLPRGVGHRGPARPRGPLTPILPVERHPTFATPATNPGARTRDEAWAAYSRDGLWEYHRVDDGDRSPWTAIYRPTGQTREHFGSLADAREATAGRLLAELRAEAFTAAFTLAAGDPWRQAGQRYLAVHMRLAGIGIGIDVQYRCECGGLLVAATAAGQLAHVDVCAECYTYGQGVTGRACQHRVGHTFCGDPTPATCGHHLYNGCTAPALPTSGAGCGRAESVDCCQGCCHDE